MCIRDRGGLRLAQSQNAAQLLLSCGIRGIGGGQHVGVEPVSYTHLDVYKRQTLMGAPQTLLVVYTPAAAQRTSALMSARSYFSAWFARMPQ